MPSYARALFVCSRGLHVRVLAHALCQFARSGSLCWCALRAPVRVVLGGVGGRSHAAQLRRPSRSDYSSISATSASAPKVVRKRPVALMYLKRGWKALSEDRRKRRDLPARPRGPSSERRKSGTHRGSGRLFPGPRRVLGKWGIVRGLFTPGRPRGRRARSADACRAPHGAGAATPLSSRSTGWHGPVALDFLLHLRDEFHRVSAVVERCVLKLCRSWDALVGSGRRSSFGRVAAGLLSPPAAAFASSSALSLRFTPLWPKTQRSVTRVPGCTLRRRVRAL